MQSSSASTLLPGDQSHIDWNSPSIQNTVKMMESAYPGGVPGYVKKAKQLLSPSSSSLATTSATATASSSNSKKRDLENPSHKVDIDYSSPSSMQSLQTGNEIAGRETIFVLVAGGLGERLGAKSLKLALPVFTCDVDTDATTTTEASPSSSQNQQDVRKDVYSKNNFLTHYLSWMDHLRRTTMIASSSTSDKAQQQQQQKTPVIIMTSDDTHSRTVDLLSDFYKLHPQAETSLDINLFKQNSVPCVSDINGTLAVTEDGKSFIMKPPGHGQVHRLILKSGVIPKYISQGFKYISFLQDTNAGAPTTIPFSLATMAEKKWTMSFTCVPRLPGEAIGALVEANINSEEEKNKKRVTYCVEYNVLDQLLKEEGIEGGDTPSVGSAFSPFPGTINTLLIELDQYNETLTRTEGAVAEFINPKYSDPKTKTTFKSPARLETLMQDIALDLLNNKSGDIIIGACVFDRRTYFPVKNALNDGLNKWKTQGIDPHNGSQGEAGLHLLRRLLWKNFINTHKNQSSDDDCSYSWPLESCLPSSDNINSSKFKPFTDVIVQDTLPLALFPIFISENNDKEGLVGISRHFLPGNKSEVLVTRKSALVLKTGDVRKNVKIIIKSLNLDGSLVIDASEVKDGTEVIVDGLTVKNIGWKVVAVDVNDERNQALNKEAHLLRGFKFDRDVSETAIFKIPSTGEENQQYVLGNNNNDNKLSQQNSSL